MIRENKSFYELFEKVTQSNADKACILYNNLSFCYSETKGLANSVIQKLKVFALSKQDLVVIFSDKNVMSYATMLACLNQGFIYTNLDPAAPLSRTKKILSKCKPKVAVFDYAPNDELLEVLENLRIPHLFLKDSTTLTLQENSFDEARTVMPEDIAYLMFTSGSTGEPKGVSISHRSLLNFIQWSADYFDVSSRDIFTQINPLYFDNSVFDFFTALSSGAAIAPVKKSQTENPLELVRYIETLKCTVWFGVPSIFVYLHKTKSFEGQNLKNLRTIVFGGEGFPKGTLNYLFGRYGEKIEFVNVYGPTEVTCICSAYKVTKRDFADLKTLLPLGKIIQFVEFSILTDGALHKKEEKLGELLLHGENLSVGYYNDEELTNEKFIFENKIRMYKTGDLVSLKNNNLHFFGRNDSQIKRMGYRIELQELEFAINGIQGVLESAAIFNEAACQFGRIYLFFSANSELIHSEVLAELKRILPRYMLPDELVQLGEIPKNANGKIDRNRLKHDMD